MSARPLYELAAGFNAIFDLVLDDSMDLDQLEEAIQSIECEVEEKCANADAAAALANATWVDSISLANVMDVNTIFWVKAMSDSSETPQNDTSVDLQAEGLVVAEA